MTSELLHRNSEYKTQLVASQTCIISVSLISQVESVGSVGNVFSDLRWGSQDQEEDLCEDLGDSSVYWTAGRSSEMWKGSVPKYEKPLLQPLQHFTAFISLYLRFASFSVQPNVSMCALRAVPVTTAAAVCATATSCTDKSKV